MEPSPRVRALAWTHVILNGVCLVGGIALCIALVPPQPIEWRDSPLLIVGPLFLLLAGIWFLPGLVGAWGLLHGRHWGRNVLIVESVILLLAFPLGTMLGRWGLFVLLKTEFDPQAGGIAEYVPAGGSPTRPSPQRGLLLPMAGVGAGFIVLLGTGYRLSGDTYQPIGPVVYYGAVVVLALSIGVAVRAIHSGQWPARSVRGTAGFHAGDNRQLLFSRRPADLVDEHPRPADADSQLGTCRHLQPIEQAMQNEGILIGLITQLQVRAYCVIDQAVLRQRFPLGGPVDYFEPSGYGRVADDPPAALIACDSCHSVIEVVHGDAAIAETPVFPGPVKAGPHV